MTTKKSKQTEHAKPVTLVYVGPSINKLGLQQFALFREARPVYTDAAVKDCPDLAELFLPVEQLNAARRDISRNGSRLQTVFNNVRSFFNNRKG